MIDGQDNRGEYVQALRPHPPADDRNPAAVAVGWPAQARMLRTYVRDGSKVTLTRDPSALWRPATFRTGGIRSIVPDGQQRPSMRIRAMCEQYVPRRRVRLVLTASKFCMYVLNRWPSARLRMCSTGAAKAWRPTHACRSAPRHRGERWSCKAWCCVGDAYVWVTNERAVVHERDLAATRDFVTEAFLAPACIDKCALQRSPARCARRCRSGPAGTLCMGDVSGETRPGMTERRLMSLVGS